MPPRKRNPKTAPDQAILPHPGDQAIPVGPNAKAIDTTLAELERMGRLEQVDAARVQALRSIAAALDDHPFNSQMWREYREAIEGLTADDSDDGSVDDLIGELSSPVRDPAPS